MVSEASSVPACSLFQEQLDNKSVDLESLFFDLESELERKRLCRDLVCTVDSYEKGAAPAKFVD